MPPYPYCIEEDRHDVPLEDCWYARPQLFFNCNLRPKDGRQPKNPTYRYGPDGLSYYLVFFSTFEELTLPIKGPMEDAGVIKLYKPTPTPCLYVAMAENMVGRVPLFPVNETTERKKAAQGEKFKCGWETRRHSKADKA